VQQTIYLLDFQKMSGDAFSYMTLCANIITELKTLSAASKQQQTLLAQQQQAAAGQVRNRFYYKKKLSTTLFVMYTHKRNVFYHPANFACETGFYAASQYVSGVAPAIFIIDEMIL
jgi:hypothetical protein